jgi:imidazolonepropionase-like amidohydrolase
MKQILLLALLSPIGLFAQKTLLYCGKLVDVKAGKVQTAYTIVIDGKKIQSVQAGYLPAGKGDRVIDLKNKTVMPGLIDMHVHMESETNPNAY